MRRVIKKIFFSLTLILCLALLVGGVVLYNQLSDKELIRQLVVEELSRLTQKEVTLAEANFEIAEIFKVRLNQVKFRNRENGQIDGSAEKIQIAIRLIHLFKRNIRIKAMEAEGVFIKVIRNEHGETFFGGTNSIQSFQGTSSFSLWQTSLSYELKLKNSRILFEDRLVNRPQGILIPINNISLNLKKPFLSSNIVLQVNGEVPPYQERNIKTSISLDGKIKFSSLLGAKQANYSANVKIKKLALNAIEPYGAQFLSQIPRTRFVNIESKITGILGKNNLSKGVIEILDDTNKRGEFISQSNTPVGEKINFEMKLEDESVFFNELTYFGGPLQVKAKGEIDDVFSNNPKINGSLSSNEFLIENSLHYLPFQILPKEAFEKFLKCFSKGKLIIESLKYQGSFEQFLGVTDPENRRNLIVNLNFNGVDLGPEFPELKHLVGKYQFKKETSFLEIQTADFRKLKGLKIEGKIANVGYDPNLDLNISGTGSLTNLEEVVFHFFPNRDSKNFSYGVEKLLGKFQGEISLIGPLRPEEIGVQGKINLSDTYLKDKSFAHPFTNVQGEVEFESDPMKLKLSNRDVIKRPWEVFLNKFSGEYFGLRVKNFDGEIFIKRRVPNQKYQGTFEWKNWNAQHLLPADTNSQLGKIIKKIKFLKGEADFYYEEGLHPLKDSRLQKSNIRFKDASFAYINGLRPINQLNALLEWDDQKISFKTEKAFYGDSPIHLDGEISGYKGETSDLKILIQSSDFMSEDFADIPILRKVDYVGPANVSVRVNFYKSEMNIESHIDLTNTSYSFPEKFSKPEKISNHIEAFAKLDPKGEIIFNKLVFELDGNKVLGSGNIIGFENPEFKLKLGSRNIDLHSFSAYFALLNGTQQGLADFEFHSNGAFDKPEEYEYEGDIVLKKWKIKTPYLTRSVQLSGNLKFLNSQIDFTKGNLVSGRTNINIESKVLLNDLPQADLRIGGKVLRLDDFISFNNSESNESLLDKILKLGLLEKGSATIQVNLANYSDPLLDLKNVRGKFYYKNRILETKKLVVGLPKESQLMMKANLNLKNLEKPIWKGTILGNQIKSKGFFRIFKDLFYQSLTGDMKYIKLDFESASWNWDKFKRNLKGHLHFIINKGKIHVGRLMNGACQLFDFPLDEHSNMERLKSPSSDFIKISGDFDVVGGVAHTENFYYENPNQKFSLIGKFDLNKNTMNTIIGVAPLKGLDDFFKSIPVVGNIVTGGDEGSVIKNYYSAKGPFVDPKVSSVPLTTLGKKVVGTLKSLLQTPQNILSVPSSIGSKK